MERKRADYFERVKPLNLSNQNEKYYDKLDCSDDFFKICTKNEFTDKPVEYSIYVKNPIKVDSIGNNNFSVTRSQMGILFLGKTVPLILTKEESKNGVIFCVDYLSVMDNDTIQITEQDCGQKQLINAKLLKDKVDQSLFDEISEFEAITSVNNNDFIYINNMWHGNELTLFIK